MRRPMRSKSVRFSCPSSWRIWCESVGCVTCNFAAALVKCTASATARKYRRWRSSINPRFIDTIYQLHGNKRLVQSRTRGIMPIAAAHGGRASNADKVELNTSKHYEHNNWNPGDGPD